MIKIKSYNKFIITDKIKEIIELLPIEYKKINFKIIILNNKWEFLKYIFHIESILDIKKIYFNKSTYVLGTCYERANYIFIFSYQFNIKSSNDKICMLRCIRTLIHEIRHMYQKEYIKKKFDKESEYKEQWQEKDAKSFASDFMEKNLKTLELIFNK